MSSSAVLVVKTFGAADGESLRCWDCSNWVGRCLKGKRNVIASSEACGDLSSRR